MESSIPRTGSLGMARDLWALTHAACYIDVEVGHAWEPPAEIAQKMAYTDEAFDAGFMRDPEVCDAPIRTVPFSPKCKDCRRAAKRVMSYRGLSSEQIQRCFDALGARWDWTTREKQEARKASDHGQAILDPAGPGFILDSTLRARQHRNEMRIVASDRRAASKARAKARR